MYQWYSYKCHRNLVKLVGKRLLMLTKDLVQLEKLKHKHEKRCRLRDEAEHVHGHEADAGSSDDESQ
jgi:hypothetical protein